MVIVHVEANVHLHRTLDNIRKMGTRPCPRTPPLPLPLPLILNLLLRLYP